MDRSAHSLIGRFVLRSNGAEVERLDYYDTMVAVINDATYRPSDIVQHSWEGHPTMLSSPPRVYPENVNKVFDTFDLYYPSAPR